MKIIKNPICLAKKIADTPIKMQRFDPHRWDSKPLRREQVVNVEFPLHHAELAADSTWKRVPNQTSQPSRWFVGPRMIEDADGIFTVTKNGVQNLAAEAHLKIVGKKIIHEPSGDTETRLVCQISCRAWGNRIEEIEVAAGEYKNVFSAIRKKFPDVAIPAVNASTFEEYLADAAKKAVDVPVIHEAVLSGWTEWDGRAHYVIGTDPYYIHHTFPEQIACPESVVARAQEFLEIGHKNTQICTLWLAFHLAPLLYWLEQENLAFHATFFVRGGTNLLKTSVVRTITDVFNGDRQRAVIRLNSTPAGTQNVIAKLRDTVVCVDDFSNTEVRSRSQSISAAEALIRAVGDGVFPTKCDPDDVKRPLQRSVRSVVVMTGEEGLNLGNSSNLRMLVLPVRKGTFDGKALEPFQRHPEFLRDYAAMFINYLEENGQSLIENMRDRFIDYRNAYAEMLSVPRLAEAGAILRIAVDCIGAFLREKGMALENELYLSAIDKALTYSENESNEERPERLFLEALKDLIGARNFKIAPNEAAYALAEDDFVGFINDEWLWLRPHDVYQEVLRYYASIGKDFLVKPKRLKEMLYEAGIIRGIEDECTHKREYVFRAKKGSRKRMIVMKKEVLNFTKEE